MKKEGKNVIGLDFDKTTVSFVKKRMPDLTLVCGDVKQLPFKKQTLTT